MAPKEPTPKPGDLILLGAPDDPLGQVMCHGMDSQYTHCGIAVTTRHMVSMRPRYGISVDSIDDLRSEYKNRSNAVFRSPREMDWPEMFLIIDENWEDKYAHIRTAVIGASWYVGAQSLFKFKIGAGYKRRTCVEWAWRMYFLAGHIDVFPESQARGRPSDLAMFFDRVR